MSASAAVHKAPSVSAKKPIAIAGGGGSGSGAASASASGASSSTAAAGAAAPTTPPLSLVIKTLTGLEIACRVNRGHTIAQLKQQFWKTMHFPTAGMELVYKGLTLSDDQTFAQLGASDGDFLVLLFNKKRWRQSRDAEGPTSSAASLFAATASIDSKDRARRVVVARRATGAASSLAAPRRPVSSRGTGSGSGAGRGLNLPSPASLSALLTGGGAAAFGRGSGSGSGHSSGGGSGARRPAMMNVPDFEADDENVASDDDEDSDGDGDSSDAQARKRARRAELETERLRAQANAASVAAAPAAIAAPPSPSAASVAPAASDASSSADAPAAAAASSAQLAALLQQQMVAAAELEAARRAQAAAAATSAAAARQRDRERERERQRDVPPAEGKITQITGMGFSRNAAFRALLLHRHSVELALNFLLENNAPTLNAPFGEDELAQMTPAVAAAAAAAAGGGSA